MTNGDDREAICMLCAHLSAHAITVCVQEEASYCSVTDILNTPRAISELACLRML